MKNKKWILSVWAAVIATAVVIVGLIGFIAKRPDALGVLMQGLGAMGGVLTIYGAANVAQKNIISQHYVAELDEPGSVEGE